MKSDLQPFARRGCHGIKGPTQRVRRPSGVVEEKCQRIKRRLGGSMKLRGVAGSSLFVGSHFRRVKDYREIRQPGPPLERATKSVAA